MRVPPSRTNVIARRGCCRALRRSGRGRQGIVELGRTDDIFAAPNHPYTQALIAEVPRIDARRKTFAAIKGEIPSPLHPPAGCHFHPRCPHAFERCRIERQAFMEIAPGRLSACHLNDAA
jgi:peptide/nickel transport system ATP-binding protein